MRAVGACDNPASRMKLAISLRCAQGCCLFVCPSAHVSLQGTLLMRLSLVVVVVHDHDVALLPLEAGGSSQTTAGFYFEAHPNHRRP